MFTGIIETAGVIRRADAGTGLVRLEIESPFAAELEPGQSVAHNGVCLTVEEKNEDSYTVAVIQETLARTSLGSLAAGSRVNLERCLRADGRLDGHVVQGHVDCTGRISEVFEEPGQKRFRVAYPDSFRELVVEKGSIAVDGISLTVASVKDAPCTFDVCLIPHTLALTNAGVWKKNDTVNLEFDILGKYVKKWMDARNSAPLSGN